MQVMIALLLQAALPLSVQAVDEGWLPMPGVEVQVVRVQSCRVSGTPKLVRGAKPQRALTAPSGWAEFTVNVPADYGIRIEGQGGFEGRSRCIHLFDLPRDPVIEPHAFVQIPMRLKDAQVRR